MIKIWASRILIRQNMESLRETEYLYTDDEKH